MADQMPPGLTIYPITGLGDVHPGDDLAELIATAAPWLADGDVLVVTSKIVSKAEGNLVPVPPQEGPDREAARSAALAAETARVVATRGPIRIVATRHGFVMAAAGIDASNVDADSLVLLPKDPDGSARALRAGLRERFGLDVVVIVSDTMGRPWRNGLTDVALGVAGIEAIRDYRGERDAYGNELQVTQMSPADELAGAGELVKGKYDQVPVAVVRGLGIVGTPDGAGAAVLVRSADMDMFSLGTAEAKADGLRLATRLDDADVLAQAWPAPTIASIAGSPTTDAASISHAIAAAAAASPDLTWTRDVTAAKHASADDEGEAVARLTAWIPANSDAVTAARAGAAIHILRAALASAGHRTQWLPPTRTAEATATAMARAKTAITDDVTATPIARTTQALDITATPIARPPDALDVTATPIARPTDALSLGTVVVHPRAET